MLIRSTVHLLLMFLLAIGVVQGQQVSSFGQYQPPPPYSEAVTMSQYLTMRDGVGLAISITRPSQNGKPVEGRFPVLWQHTLTIAAPGVLVSNAAGVTPGGYSAVPSLAHYGYVIVQVARRGQGPSFGKRRSTLVNRCNSHLRLFEYGRRIYARSHGSESAPKGSLGWMLLMGKIRWLLARWHLRQLGDRARAHY
jgi:hypothetical protein